MLPLTSGRDVNGVISWLRSPLRIIHATDFFTLCGNWLLFRNAMLRGKSLYASALLVRIGAMSVNHLQIQRPTDWLKNR